MVVWYQQADGMFRVSLYTDRNDVDVSEIAKAYGGGGHKKAAGFRVDVHGMIEIGVFNGVKVAAGVA